MRDYLAAKTANWLTESNTQHFESLSKLLSTKKKQEYRLLNKEEIHSIFEYSFKTLYGESFKFILMLIIAYALNIFIPTLIVCIVFATLRTAAGGAHMDSFIKCLITTAIIILVPSYALNQISLIHSFSKTELSIIIAITYIVGLILAEKYAPRDTETKIIDDPIEIKKYKHKTKVHLAVLTLESLIIMMLTSGLQLIVLSMCLGILLEMFTITPIGVKLFHNVRDVVNKAGVKQC